MSKVKCIVCHNERNSFCSVKGCKVKLNKVRVCDSFLMDDSKIRVRRSLPSVRVMPTEVAKKLRSDYRRAHRKQIEALKSNRDLAHPLTGDLSRFTTTANTGEDKNGS